MLASLAEQVQRDDDEHAQMQMQMAAAGAMAAAGTGTDAATVASSSPVVSSLSLPLLQSLQSIWSAHCQEMLIIRGIFLFLDRTYVMQQAMQSGAHNNMTRAMRGDAEAKRPPASLWELGLNLFAEHLQSPYTRASCTASRGNSETPAHNID